MASVGFWWLLLALASVSSLFPVLQSALSGSLHDVLLLSCSPVVVRIRRVLQKLAKAWTGGAAPPASLVGPDLLLAKAAAWRNCVSQQGELHLLGN